MASLLPFTPPILLTNTNPILLLFFTPLTTPSRAPVLRHPLSIMGRFWCQSLTDTEPHRVMMFDWNLVFICCAESRNTLLYLYQWFCEHLRFQTRIHHEKITKWFKSFIQFTVKKQWETMLMMKNKRQYVSGSAAHRQIMGCFTNRTSSCPPDRSCMPSRNFVNPQLLKLNLCSVSSNSKHIK